MAKPKNPPKKNPPKKNVKQRFVDGKLEPFPKRGKPKQNIRKAAGSGPAPSNVKSCARTLAEYKYRKDIDYKKYLLEKGKARVAKEKAEKSCIDTPCIVSLGAFAPAICSTAWH